MHDRSLSVYVKKWIIVFIVNKLNFIYFTCFVYTFFTNYKYSVLWKRDDVCLIPLSTLVALSHFDEGKEIGIACSKISSPSFSTVSQRCDNVKNDVVTMLSQSRCASWGESFKQCVNSIVFKHFNDQYLLRWLSKLSLWCPYKEQCSVKRKFSKAEMLVS